VYDVTAASIVRRVRETAQLSQRDLAARAQTTQAVVARIESGKAQPSLEMLKRLAAAGGLDLACELQPARASDPVVDAYKPGVDKTLLIDNLRKTPRERFERALAARRFILEVRRAGVEARRRAAEPKATYRKEQ
jgi:transcriptional regulator with XRE-family HTH domain